MNNQSLPVCGGVVVVVRLPGSRCVDEDAVSGSHVAGPGEGSAV